MAEPVQQVAYDDEIDLRAMVQVLIRRSRLILGITLGAVALAALLSLFVLEPVFESEVRLFLPQVEPDLAMSPEQYREYAVGEAVLEPVIAGMALDLPAHVLARRSFSVRLDAKNTVLEVTVSAPTAEESHHLASLWLTSFADSVQEYLERNLEQAITEADRAVSIMRAGLEGLGDALGVERREADFALELATASAYAQEYGAALRERARLLGLRETLALQARPEILTGPTVPTAPASPRITLNLVVAAVVGGMFAVFLAFGLEWWHGTDGTDSPEVRPAA